jgi:coenzyme PQQ precursor peptide PqqA
MQWTRPDFEEITLGMEVTAYVNTDERPAPPEDRPRAEPAPAGGEQQDPSP